MQNTSCSDEQTIVMHESSSSVHFWKAHSTTHWETLFVKTKVENTLKKKSNPQISDLYYIIALQISHP